MTRPLDAVLDVVSPAQLRSIVESRHARMSVWIGSVRSGKTIASLIAWLIALNAAPDTGLVVLVGRTLQTIERNVIEPLQDAGLFGVIAGHVHHTRGSTTATVLGRTIHLIGASDSRAEARIRGMTACLAYVDEATLIPEAVWVMLLSRLSVPGARLLATTNPDGPGHWLRRDYLLRAGALNLAAWRFRLDDNPSLTPAYVTALKAEYTGLWYRRYITGDWCLAEGAVYDAWDPDRHIIDVLPPIRRWVALGIDYGTVNPFAALLIGIGVAPATDRPALYLAREWRWDSRAERRQLTDSEYADRLTGWLGGVRPEWTVVDPSASSFVTELHRRGQLNPALADNSVADGLRTVAAVIARGQLYAHRSCTGWNEEVGGYSWDPAAAARGDDKPIKVADHSLDAVRYGVHTTQAAWRPAITQEAA